MPKQYTVSVTWFDTCYVDYLTDHTGIIIGVSRSGQTRDELIDEVTGEIYSHEDSPCGDHVHQLIEDAVRDAITDHEGDNGSFRFWPVDEHGNEIRDLDSESIPDEQPAAWFRVEIEEENLKISLRNTDDDDGSVMVDCADGGAAGDDRTIDGSTWELLEDGSAYTILIDRKTLVAELTAEGYDVDCSEYSEPDDEDLKFWLAKCERDGANYPDAAMLREIMGWTTIADVEKCRRVTEQFYMLNHSTHRPMVAHWLSMSVPQRQEEFVRLCWEAGLPLDAEYLTRYERVTPV